MHLLSPAESMSFESWDMAVRWEIMVYRRVQMLPHTIYEVSANSPAVLTVVNIINICSISSTVPPTPHFRCSNINLLPCSCPSPKGDNGWKCLSKQHHPQHSIGKASSRTTKEKDAFSHAQKNITVTQAPTCAFLVMKYAVHLWQIIMTVIGCVQIFFE